VLAGSGADFVLLMLGAGEMELKPTRSLKLAPWDAGTGLGAAYWVLCARDVADSGGGRFEIEGFEGAEDCVVGVADWKSSKSSSSAPPDEAPPSISSIGFETAFLPLVVKGFGGVSGGISSSSNPRMSISGSFFLGGSAFFGSRLTAVEEVSAFRRPEEATAPSSNSSYSSNRSLLLLESWKPDVFPP